MPVMSAILLTKFGSLSGLTPNTDEYVSLDTDAIMAGIAVKGPARPEAASNPAPTTSP